MMSRWFLFGLLMLLLQLANGQTFDYYIHFADKGNNYSVNAPEVYLSQRAIDRREKQEIPITPEDFPIDPDYRRAVLDVAGVRYLAHSKWMNSLSIRVEDTAIVERIRLMQFVEAVEMVPSSAGKQHRTSRDKFDERLERGSSGLQSVPYGQAFNQIQMLNAIPLHNRGFKGRNMVIAVMDGGFSHVDEMIGFEDLRKDGRILGTYDFVQQTENVYAHSTHGTLVLSTMAGMMADTFLGTAPEASYYLFRTEDGRFEYLMEEDFWITAAEFADSAGADVLNTSLGYNTFDDSLQDHTYEDMDGQTTRISIASGIAAQKGMIVVNSAGNSGGNPWHYVNAPADADGILAIGAVRDDRGVAAFSSRGPSYDGRIKPDVMAQGAPAMVMFPDNGVGGGYGTSFSGPIVAGLAAVLWQAYPEMKASAIRQAIIESADRYFLPTSDYGHGIPDFELASVSLAAQREGSGLGVDPVTIYPNPFVNDLSVFYTAQKDETITFSMSDMMGRLVIEEETYQLKKGQSVLVNWADELNDMAEGMYFINSLSGDQLESHKVVRTK